MLSIVAGQEQRVEDLELYAYVGLDELGSGELGLKQARVPAGYIALVATNQAKLDGNYIKNQLALQMRAYGQKIQLVRFKFAEVVFDIEPRAHLTECPAHDDPTMDCLCDDWSPD